MNKKPFDVKEYLKSIKDVDMKRTFSMSIIPKENGYKTRGVFDIPGRLVEFSLSSEDPYIRYMHNAEWEIEKYYEILDHSDGAIDFSRLKNGSNLFLNHDTDGVVLGVIEDVKLIDKKIVEVARFSKNPEPDLVFKDIVDGIRSKISVGYTVVDMVEVEKIDGIRAFRCKFVPHESSVVGVAADDTIGIGRSKGKVLTSVVPLSLEPKEEKAEAPNSKGLETENKIINEGKKMDELEKSKLEKSKLEKEKADLASQIEVGKSLEKNTQDILAAGKAFNQIELAAKFVSEKKTLADFQKQIESMFQENPEKFLKKGQKDADDLGMSEKDIQRWSLMNYVKAREDNISGKTNTIQCFEVDVSQQVEKQTGAKAKGIRMPVDILRGKGITGAQKQQRAMAIGSATTGGNLVQTTLLTEQFVDVLRTTDVTSQLGFTTINGLRGYYNILRKTSAAVVAWVTENGSAAESTALYDLIAMSGKAVTGQSISSREQRLQSAVDADAFMMMDLIASLNNDKATKYFTGTGSSGQITGLLAQSGINSISPSANGDAPTWALMNQMKKEIRIDNVQGVLKLIINAATEYALSITPKVTAMDHYLLDETTGRVANMETFVTNMLPSNITKGSSGATLSKAIALEPSNVVIGNWGGIDIIVDPYTYSSDFRLKISAIQDTDLVLKHAEAVCVFADIITA